MEDNNMKRGLKSRHISMIAIGGAIGTGLFVATASVISASRSRWRYISLYSNRNYALLLMSSIGELATFTQYQDHSVLIQLAL